jgi:hypothetical protein
MGEAVHSTCVVLDARPTPEDLRALHRWASPLPRRLRMAGGFLLLGGALVALIERAPMLVYLGILFVQWFLVTCAEAGVAADAASRTTTEIDQQGIRIRGTTLVEVPWESVERVELTDERLFLLHHRHPVVAVVRGLADHDVALLRDIIAGRPPATAPLGAGPMLTGARGAGADLVVRWRGSRRDAIPAARYRAKRFPGARGRRWRVCLLATVAFQLLATLAGWRPDVRELVLVAVLVGEIPALVIPTLTGWLAATRTRPTEHAVRVDAGGVVVATPTVRRWMPYDGIAAWGFEGDALCVVGRRAGMVVIPATAVTDELVAALARHAGPPSDPPPERWRHLVARPPRGLRREAVRDHRHEPLVADADPHARAYSYVVPVDVAHVAAEAAAMAWARRPAGRVAMAIGVVVVASGFLLTTHPHGSRPAWVLAAASAGIGAVAGGHLAGVLAHYVQTRIRIRPWSTAGTVVRAELGSTSLVIRARALPVLLHHDDIRRLAEHGPVVTLSSWDGRAVTFPRALLPEAELDGLAAVASTRRAGAGRG